MGFVGINEFAAGVVFFGCVIHCYTCAARPLIVLNGSSVLSPPRLPASLSRRAHKTRSQKKQKKNHPELKNSECFADKLFSLN